MATNQLTMFVTDYEQRSDARDMAAYRALGSITAAVVYLRENDPKTALHILTSAIETYERADAKLQNLKKGETPCRSH